MTWVKICGLRTPADVEAANAAGADAVGFVVADSPRRVAVQDVEGLAALTPLLTVLVTQDLPSEEVEGLLAQTGVGALQPHGRHQVEATAIALAAGREVLFPVRSSSAVDWSVIPAGVIPLLDADVPGRGRPFDWTGVGRTGRRFVLAGGLTPDNVAGAVATTGAWGVDVSSGVESTPGRKDPALIHHFVERAKSS